jgi:hypothetical protein
MDRYYMVTMLSILTIGRGDPMPDSTEIVNRVIAYKEDNGYWSEYPGYYAEDWQYEVANGDCRRGYWEWVAARIEEEAHE